MASSSTAAGTKTDQSQAELQPSAQPGLFVGHQGTGGRQQGEGGYLPSDEPKGRNPQCWGSLLGLRAQTVGKWCMGMMQVWGVQLSMLLQPREEQSCGHRAAGLGLGSQEDTVCFGFCACVLLQRPGKAQQGAN